MPRCAAVGSDYSKNEGLSEDMKRYIQETQKNMFEINKSRLKAIEDAIRERRNSDKKGPWTRFAGNGGGGVGLDAKLEFKPRLQDILCTRVAHFLNHALFPYCSRHFWLAWNVANLPIRMRAEVCCGNIIGNGVLTLKVQRSIKVPARYLHRQIVLSIDKVLHMIVRQHLKSNRVQPIDGLISFCIYSSLDSKIEELMSKIESLELENAKMRTQLSNGTSQQETGRVPYNFLAVCESTILKGSGHDSASIGLSCSS